MINKIGLGRHLFVGGAVVIAAGLGAFGIVGAGDQGRLRAEHFDAKHVTVRPASDGEGVRISEVVDIDFGVRERRGYQRIIPNDFGAPTDVEASSPDANGQLNIVPIGRETRIRIGNPNVTFTGQHRYLLDYTLPDAGLGSGRLALDIIGTAEEFQTDRFEVVVAGFQFDEPADLQCDVGQAGDFGGCTFEQTESGEYRTVIEPLKPGEGITVSGTFTALVDAPESTMPALSERNSLGFQPVGLAQLGIGSAIVAGVFGWFRRRGSNVVYGAGGAADAAFLPSLPPPDVDGISHELAVPAAGDWIADVPTYRVPDNRLAELATIEFVPPRGVEPWQGAVLLSESVDSHATSAWFSEMIAREAIALGDWGNGPTLTPGSTDARLSNVECAHLAALFGSSSSVPLGKYDAGFAKVWKGIAAEQQRFIADSGWWERPIAGAVAVSGGVIAAGISFVFGLIAIVVATAWLAINYGIFATTAGAVLLAVLVAAVFAGLGYSSMLASRTAVGSALTLRTESFRRFLAASEGRHVDWAWEHGLIREYSAWAVALGAADAWSEAIESSNVTEPASFTAPLLVHSYASSFSSARTAPSSSGSGGGGGGGVGGGGGGGSSGSW